MDKKKKVIDLNSIHYQDDDKTVVKYKHIDLNTNN